MILTRILHDSYESGKSLARSGKSLARVLQGPARVL